MLAEERLDPDAARTLLADLLSDAVQERWDQVLDTVAAEVPSFAFGLASLAELRTQFEAVDTSARRLALERGSVDHAALYEFGLRNAEADVPVQDVQSVLWIAFEVDWQHVVRAADRRGLPVQVQVDLAGALWRFAREMNGAVVDAYRKVSARRAVELHRRTSAYVMALLQNNLPDPGTTLEALAGLGLAQAAHVCVVVVRVETLGESPLRGIRSVLAQHGMESAWHLDVDALVGIVALPLPGMVDEVRMLLLAADPPRAGISPASAPLQVPRAWQLARLALAAATSQRSVTVFGEQMIEATVASASPEVMGILGADVLRQVIALPEPTRSDLIGTFVTWLDAGGSTSATARAVFRHPNTVRYRLGKFERLTGRSLREPNNVTALTLAVRWWEQRASAR